MAYERTPGGEKNANSGKRWSREELELVFALYLQLKGEGIHENNPAIHHLSAELNRTVRSVEAQLLMFRNLERRGDYGYGNMSRKCVEIWESHLREIKRKWSS